MVGLAEFRMEFPCLGKSQVEDIETIERESGPLGYAAANSLQAKCLQLCVYVRCSENRRPNRRWGSSHPEPKKCDLLIKRASAICSVESRAVSTIDQYIRLLPSFSCLF